MTDFKKWFAARARNPDKITLEEAFAAGARSQPVPSFADAYQGAMEEVAIWKRRALEAEDLNRKFVAEINGPTYMGEPAQPALSEQDESVRKAWARFSNELHRSPDAPYPGMSEAFEKHFSQSFTDREWRAESGVWAAAWKAAKNHGALPAPKAVAYLDLGVGGYMDIGTDLTDEVLATIPKGRHMLGIVGTPEDWKPVPIEPTETMIGEGSCASSLPGPHYISEGCAQQCWKYMIAAAPEAKP